MRRTKFVVCVCLLLTCRSPKIALSQQARFLSRQPLLRVLHGRKPLLVPNRPAHSLFNVTEFWQAKTNQPNEQLILESNTLQLVEAELDPLVAPAPITFLETQSQQSVETKPTAESGPKHNAKAGTSVLTVLDEQTQTTLPGEKANQSEPPIVAKEAQPKFPGEEVPAPAGNDQNSSRRVPRTETDISARIAELESKPQTSTTIVELDLYRQAMMWLAAAHDSRMKADQLASRAQTLSEELFDATSTLEEAKQARPIPATRVFSAPELETQATGISQTLIQLAQERKTLSEKLEVVTQRMQDPVRLRNELLASLRSAEQMSVSPGQHSAAAVTESLARARMLRNQLALATVHTQTDPNVKRLLETQLATNELKRQIASEQKAQTESAAAAILRRAAAKEAAEAKQVAEQVPDGFKPFADENAVIAGQLKWIKDHDGTTRQRTAEAQTTNERLQTSFERVRRTQERTGLNTTLGLILNHELEHMPGTRVWQKRISGIKEQLHQLSEVEFDVERRQQTQSEFESQIAKATAKLIQATPDRAASIKRIGSDLISTRSRLLEETLAAAHGYSEDLTNFDARCKELLVTISAFKSHINKNVLWIRSNEPLAVSDFASFGPLATSLSAPRIWVDTANSLLTAIRESLAPLAVVTLLLLAVLSFADELRQRLKQTGELCTRDNRVQLSPTVEAIAITWLLGSAWPVFFWSLGWSITRSLGSTDIALAIAYALQTSALWWGAFSLPRAICTQSGLGQRHFGWSEAAVKSVYRGLPSIMTWGLPVVAVVAALSSYDHARWSGSVGRIAFISGALCLAFFMRRALNTESGFVVQWSRKTGWLHRCRYAICIVGCGLPIVLSITSAAGYHHSSLQLSRCLQETWMLTIGLLVSHGVLVRCVERVMQSFEEGKPVVAFPFRSRVIHPNSEEADAATQAIELAANREQVQRFLKFGIVVTAILCSWGIWHDVLPALNVVNDVHLWSMTREIPSETIIDGVTQTVRTVVPVTLGDLIRSVMVLVVTIVAARNLPGLLDTFVLRRLPFDRGGRHAISTICRYILTTVGLLLTLKQIGIDWASMQWMVAAMTVGLGFGLQEIFANFVSGLIILLERPIRLGDFVTVNGETGFVTRIQFRATTITDLDRRELLVPNKKFITDELINWTLSDPITRLVLPIGIAYGSDTTMTHRLLVEVAEEHPIVLKEPEPSAVMTAFGDSTLNFELRVFIPRRDEFAQILHELNTAIDRKFRAADIEIAFPQCDINVRGLEQLTALAARRAA